MKMPVSAAALLLVLSAACAESAVPSSSVPSEVDAAPAAPRALAGFVENRGQWAEEVLFFARTEGVEVTLTADALAFARVPAQNRPRTPSLVLRLPAGDRPGPVEGVGELRTRHNFLVASGTATDVPGYERVLYREVLPGIDLQVRTVGEGFEYDLLLEPGAPLEDFLLEVEGAERPELVEPDRLVLHTASGPVEQHIGASWQVDPERGVHEPVACSFRVLDRGPGGIRFGFAAPEWDPWKALVLDPGLIYATYVGGPSTEYLGDAAFGPDGAVYLSCRVNDCCPPTTPGAFQPSPPGSYDGWVGKLAPDGSHLEWATFLGGSAIENTTGIEVRDDGSVVVVGYTSSTDFPTTPGAYQTTHAGGSNDVFVSALDPSGSSLLWSTYIGSLENEVAWTGTILPGGDVVGATEGGPSSPLTVGAFDPTWDDGDQVIYRLSADGSTLVFSTFFAVDGIQDIATDDASNIYFVGAVYAEDKLPTTPGVFQDSWTVTPGDHGHGVVVKMAPDGAALEWATYLGATGNDRVQGVAVDAASAVYVVGYTDSVDFPVTPGVIDPTWEANPGNVQGFVTKFLPGGTGLVWSTFFSTNGYAGEVVVDPAGNPHLGGFGEVPTTPDAFQPEATATLFSSSENFLTKLGAFGEALAYSTYFGGAGSDGDSRIGVEPLGWTTLVMETSSPDLVFNLNPGTTFQGGLHDLYAVRFAIEPLPWRVLGSGLAGTSDVPNLAGAGDLTPGSPARLSVRGAAPNSNGWLVAGLTQVFQPFLGGTLVPSPDYLVAVATDGSGAIDLITPAPGLPPGTTLSLQVWVQDPGGPQGWSATNALEALLP